MGDTGLDDGDLMTLMTPPEATLLGSATYPHRRYHGSLSAVRYVHPSGDDADDGLTWGTAKGTIMGAYDALGGGGGDIYIADQSEVGGEIAGQGIQIAGAQDPNFASMDTDSGSYPGWRKTKQYVRFIGVRGSGPARILPTGGTWTSPWINLSQNVDGPIEFENLSNVFNGAGAAGIDLSRDSNGDYASAGHTASNVWFTRLVSYCTNANALLGFNPFRSQNEDMTIGPFWHHIRDCNFYFQSEEPVVATAEAIDISETAWTMAESGTPAGFPATPFIAQCVDERILVTNISGTTWTVTRAYDDTPAATHDDASQVRFDPEDIRRACMVVGGGLVDITNVICTFGGMYCYGLNGASIDGMVLESASGPAIILDTCLQIRVGEISHFDQPGSTRPRAMGIVTPFNSYPEEAVFETFGNGVNPHVLGPHIGRHRKMTFGNQRGVERTRSQIAMGGMGWSRDRFYAQTDSFRRGVSLAAAQSANLVSQDASTWTAIGDGIHPVTTGIDGPDGRTNAANIDGSGVSPNYRGIYSGTWNPTAPAPVQSMDHGSWIFWGSWVRNANSRKGQPDGSYHYLNTSVEDYSHLQIAVTAGAATFCGGRFAEEGAVVANVEPPWYGYGEWMFQCGYAKARVGGSSTIKFRIFGEIDICYPILFAKDALSDSEAAEIHWHLASWPDYAPVGHLASFRGQKILAHGGLGVGNSAAATTPGSVTRKMEVFDASGASLGFVPIYGSIT